MNNKRIFLVAVSIVGLLVVALGAVGFILTSNTSAKADGALSNPSAALSEGNATIDYDARYDANFAGSMGNPSGLKGYSGDGYGCPHDRAIDWSKED